MSRSHYPKLLSTHPSVVASTHSYFFRDSWAPELSTSRRCAFFAYVLQGQIERNDEYGPTTILGCRHTERIEPIEANGQCHVSWVFGFTFFMYFIEHLPRFTIRGVGQHQIPVFICSTSNSISVPCHLFCCFFKHVKSLKSW